MNPKGYWVRDLENPINWQCTYICALLSDRNIVGALCVVYFLYPDLFSVGKLWSYNRVYPKTTRSFQFMIFLLPDRHSLTVFSFTTNRKRESYENQNFHFMRHTVGCRRRVRKMRNHELYFRNMHIKRWRFMRRWQLLCLLRP